MRSVHMQKRRGSIVKSDSMKDREGRGTYRGLECFDNLPEALAAVVAIVASVPYRKSILDAVASVVYRPSESGSESKSAQNKMRMNLFSIDSWLH